MIDIMNLSKIYQTSSQDIIALDNVSLKVDKGDIFGIIGLSGAGKSTLIRCVNMLEKPSKGSIIIDGEDISSLGQNDLRCARQKIGMIFQNFHLLSSRTVFDNIMFPLEIAKVPAGEARVRVNELLELVGLTDKAKVYPGQLSGGQKQRVGIARALANNPRVLLSDEATSALDPQTTRSILELLKDINRQLNLTILLITHDMNVIKQVCDKVAVISDSRIVETGDVLQVISNPQTEISRSFLQTVVNRKIPSDILESLSTVGLNEKHLLVHISFVGKSAGQPFISNMTRQFNVSANILYGNIDRVKDTPFGNLTLELIGTENAVKSAIEFLYANDLEVEVLDNVGVC